MFGLSRRSRRNARRLFLCFLGCNLFLLTTPPAFARSPEPAVSLETFEDDTVLTFPQHWRVRGDAAAARTVYRVMAEDQNHFLHAAADQQAIQIGLTHTFAPEEFPLLRWRWRVTRLPPNANEARRDTHDSAAGVYVIFDNRMFPRIIKYVWSTTLPVGARVQNPLYWRAKIVVLESGAAGLGEWRQETVNVLRDYHDLFGEAPGQALGIGLSTSSSFTRSLAVADYDDFTLLTPQALAREADLSFLRRQRAPYRSLPSPASSGTALCASAGGGVATPLWSRLGSVRLSSRTSGVSSK